jgi:hypothetical protein
LLPIHSFFSHFEVMRHQWEMMATAGVTNRQEQATVKQWFTWQQGPFCVYRKWSVININQLYHLTHCWYPYIYFFNHFDSIHQEQQ